MFRSLIALLAAAALAGSAHAQQQPKGAATALELNPTGLGHLLVVPYFNTQGGNATLVNLFNASDKDKAVKIRYRNAGNGDDLFSFQVFLRARAAWTTNVSAGADGLPALIGVDRACTLPATVIGVPFRTTRLNPALTASARANEAREGYIEIIAMADVIPTTALSAAIAYRAPAPLCTPSVLNGLTRFDAQLAPPTTGLMANWILINVPQTTTWSGEAVAYEARVTGIASTGNNLYFPQTATPLTAAEVTQYTADPLYNFAQGGPIVAPASMDLPDLSTPYTATVTSPQQQATELSYEIAAQQTVVEYLTDPNIQASTDLVLSMPTRRYHAAVDYRGPTLITNRGTLGDKNAIYFTGLDQSLSEVSTAGQSCYLFPSGWFPRNFDRRGNSTDFPAISPVGYFPMCGVVPVMSMADQLPGGFPSRTLGASATLVPFGWMFPGTDGSTYFDWLREGSKGLPVLIRQFARAVNPSASPGVSGTYGFTSAGRTLLPGVPQQ